MTIDFLFSRLERDARRKIKSIEEKSLQLLRSFFLQYAYSIDLIGPILKQVNREKSHVNWTNRNFLEQVNRDEK